MKSAAKELAADFQRTDSQYVRIRFQWKMFPLPSKLFPAPYMRRNTNAPHVV